MVSSRSSFMPAEDRSVVDQIVDAAELGQRAIGHRLGRLRIGHVDRHAEGCSAVGDDLLGHPLAARGVDVGDDHRRALAGLCFGVGLADPAAGSGDDGHLLGELPHEFSSIRRRVFDSANRSLRRCRNQFDLGVLLEAGEAHLPAYAGLLVAAEQRIRRVPHPAVDVDRAEHRPGQPEPESLAIRTASSSPSWAMTVGNGPTISSRATRASLSRPEINRRLNEEAGVPVGRTTTAAYPTAR
jgi:hypothetical protein